jgi:ParB family protein of integrating conjugative element (PFGI_1 class)
MIKPTQEQISAGLRPQMLLRSPGESAALELDQESEIVVTLEQLRPYERNPRFIRNPLYDDIKSSIRERGLDQAPSITRRPSETYFIILNGGNTRLSILNELWKETRDERFFRIACRYRPWTSETHALLGHLAESDLHGQLAFIERALAVVNVKALLEDDGTSLSQRELAQALASGGYPVSQSQISRMFDTVEYLLPSLPNALCSGLPKAQVERLILLRKRAEQVWNRLLAPLDQLLVLWQQTLSNFDTTSDEFDWDEVRGALLAQMAKVLDITPRLMELELTQNGSHAAPPSEPSTNERPTATVNKLRDAGAKPASAPPLVHSRTPPMPSPTDQVRDDEDPLRLDDIFGGLRPGSTEVAEAQTTSTLSLPSLSQLMDSIAPQAIAELRSLAAELAQSLAHYAALTDFVVGAKHGLGFTLNWQAAEATAPQGVAVQLLLTSILRAQDGVEWELKQQLPPTLVGQLLVGDYLTPLGGNSRLTFELQRLPDAQLNQWVQLVVLARRIVDLSQATSQDDSETLS